MGISFFIWEMVSLDVFNIDCDLQPKCRFFDKRKPKKYVGNGIYLTPKISIIEKNLLIKLLF